jgi:hypothetical protein
MAAEQKARWRTEVDWLLSVADHIVEFVASQQVSEDGTSMEVSSGTNPSQCLYYPANKRRNSVAASIALNSPVFLLNRSW